MTTPNESFFQKTGINLNSLYEITNEDKDSGVYIIYNINSERFYIGSTINFYKRKLSHLFNLRNISHRNNFLQNDYSEQWLKFYKLENVNKEILLKIEQKYIDKFFGRKDFYNLNSSAEHNFINRKHKTKSKQLISEKNTGKKRSLEIKQQMSKRQKEKYKSGKHPLIGQIPSYETKKKISKSMAGDKNHFFGETHSEEVKQTIRNKRIGKYYGTMIQVLAINLKTNEKLIFKSTSEAARMLKLQQGHISSVANGKLKQHKGWRFEKVNNGD